MDQFDFTLPEERIALRPALPRDTARLLHVPPGDAPFAHHQMRDLPSLLRPGDVLVVNDTKVIPAQLTARRGDAHIGVTLHKRLELARWQAFLSNARRAKVGDTLLFTDRLSALVEEKPTPGEAILHFSAQGSLETALDEAGRPPLPPYIARRRTPDAQDEDDYQTLFATTPGAVAAPTAGLHFTPELLESLTSRGVTVIPLTLHVGAGTFLPVQVEDPRDHVMHSEWGSLSAETADALNTQRAKGGRIIAVGTTSARLLESAVQPDGTLGAFAGETAIFLHPENRPRLIDGLVTNFHLPRSTLFMLVCGLVGTARMHAAYAEAMAQHYRFYSYGDATLLWRTP